MYGDRNTLHEHYSEDLEGRCTKNKMFRVTRLMRVSCGGVIGFSIVAIIIVIIGIAVCLNPSKPNRVSPVAEETSNITSRH
ncbi:hypothetical protein RRG08_002603 [Elysia crispata]|uniref:Uncharacterized protein n=1 Tax=Elysia crispata TaxID=231223 RepID=A0AAE1CSH6_9GAST|nr:hypothetical protein RRG08_002603 [Elysia crispata]